MQRYFLIALIALFSFSYFLYAKTAQNTELVATENLQSISKIKILLVAGHDDEVTGARNNGVGEVELNRILVNDLYELLKADSLFEPVRNQEDGDYIPELKKYFEGNAEKIIAYRKERREASNAKDDGRGIDDDPVIHNEVTESVANKLYGTSMWAEEMGFDVILHVHFNDYPGRPRNKPGKYFGFVVYAPDDSLKNYTESLSLARVIYDELAKFQPKSNLPVEKAGIIESNDLIALGARDSLSIPSVLVEYAYIAEPRLQGEGRDGEIKKMAEQTYEALKLFYR